MSNAIVARQADPRMSPSPQTSLRWPLLAGAAIALAFFAGLGSWAAVAPLAGAAIAPAIVAPAGSRKIVQHLEGGIVRRILVKDGSTVAAGAALIELDGTPARAEHAALLAQWWALKAIETRLLVEQSGAPAVRFPPELTAAAAEDGTLARLLASEADRLIRRRAYLADQKGVLGERIAQAGAEIQGLEAQIASGHRRLELNGEETAVVERLLAQGNERRPRLLALEREQAEIEGTIGANRAAIARARMVIAETRQQISSLDSEQAEQVARELTETRTSLAELEKQLRATADRLARTLITAPVAGTVVALKVKTPGGVISPGEPLLDLVPAEDGLVLEARIAPVDIDEVYPGLEAQVHLLAYQSRNLPRVQGTVEEVSADRLEDPDSHQPYYLARVAIAPSGLPAGLQLAPGMPAEVMIVTGERTLIDYLLRPLTDTIRRGLRES